MGCGWVHSCPDWVRKILLAGVGVVGVLGWVLVKRAMVVNRLLAWGGAESAVALLMIAASLFAFVGGRISVSALAADVLALVLALVALRWLGLGIGLLLPGLAVVLWLDPDGSGMALYLCALPTVTAIRLGRIGLAGVATAIGGAAGWWVSCRVHPDDRDLIGITITWLFTYGMVWAVGFAGRALARAAEERVHRDYQERALDLARDLHDSTARNLAVLAMQADAAVVAGSATPEQLESMAQMAREASVAIRRTMQLLGGRPAAPERDTGLSMAVDVGRAELERLGFEVRVSIEVDAPLRTAVDHAAGRIMLEALHNVAKHGNPDGPCLIMVEATDDALDFAVTNTPRAGAAGGHSGLGLESMGNQARAGGGLVSAGLSHGVWVLEASLPLVQDTRSGVA